VVRAVFSPDYRWVAFVSWDRSAALLDLRAPATAPPVRLTHLQQFDLPSDFAPVYGWFTEGFDTPDLMEAKTLLEELAA
jgi:hypothetical protein